MKSNTNSRRLVLEVGPVGSEDAKGCVRWKVAQRRNHQTYKLGLVCGGMSSNGGTRWLRSKRHYTDSTEIEETQWRREAKV